MELTTSKSKSTNRLKTTQYSQNDPLGDLIVALFGPFIGIILMLASPWFIAEHEKQCGRLQLFKDCWLDQQIPKSPATGELNQCIDGFFTLHKGFLSGCKFYEFKQLKEFETDSNESILIYPECLSIRKISYTYCNGMWNISHDTYSNEMESQQQTKCSANCNYAVVGNVEDLRLTIHQINRLEKQGLVVDSKDGYKLKELEHLFQAIYAGKNIIISNNEVLVLQQHSSQSLQQFNDGDFKFVQDFKLLKDYKSIQINTFGLKYQEHIVPFQYFDQFKLPPVQISFNSTQSLSNYQIEQDTVYEQYIEQVNNLEKMNKLGVEQLDYQMKQYVVMQESTNNNESFVKYQQQIEIDLNGEMKDKMIATRVIIIFVFAILPHLLMAAPLFQIFKALWIIGFIPALLMMALCLIASIGWQLFVSGFVWIPQSVVSSSLCTIFGLGLFAGSWVLSQLMVTGLVHGAQCIWGAITGSSC